MFDIQDPKHKFQYFSISILTRNAFKKRHNAHKHSFRHMDVNSTMLSTHLWKLSDEGINHDISWKIIDRAQDFNPITRKCNLCLKEKFHIIFQPEVATLNYISELFSTTCKHRLRLLLSNT